MKRPLLLPLLPPFCTVVALKNAAYSAGWIKPKRLGWPVLSVGSLSAGGAGKTPLVIRLADLLKGRGIFVDVLSRGYRRQGKETEAVDPNGTAARFGDEPLLIARSAGVPVFVGGSRFLSGQLAEKTGHAAGVHLLDDGFQHRKLGRQSDIVLVTERDFDDTMLPAGNLREPLSALCRSTWLAVRAEEPDIVARLRALGLAQPLLILNRHLDVPLEGESLLAFCGIARADDFFAGVKTALESRGARVVTTLSFPDHHGYNPADALRLARLAAESHADGFLTTEKDAIKLDPGLREILEKCVPLRVVRLRVSLENEEEAVGAILHQLALPRAVPFL